MKRFLTYFLSFVIVLSLFTGCTKGKDDAESSIPKVQNPYINSSEDSKKEDSESSTAKEPSESSKEDSSESSKEDSSESKVDKPQNSSENTFEGSTTSESSESSQTSESSESSSESSDTSGQGQYGQDESEFTIPPLVEFEETLTYGRVVVPGIEQITDYEGNPAIRVYYEFTNLSEEPLQTTYYLTVNAYQDGEKLTSTWCTAYDDVPDVSNEWLWVYPGHTVRCFKEFNFDTTSGKPILVEFYDGDYAYIYVPSDVAYQMAYNWAPFPAFMPEFTKGLKSGGYLTGGQFLGTDSCYYLYPLDDSTKRAVEFNFTFENTTDKAVQPSSLVFITAYQDGVQLKEMNSYEPFYYTDTFYKSVAPGETITFQMYFMLRTDDPVEVLIKEHYPNTITYGVMFSEFSYY